MHKPNFSSSGQSFLPVPSNAIRADIPKPKISHRIRQFFRFGRSRSQARPSSAVGVASSSRPPLDPGTSQQVQDGPVGAHQDIPDTSARSPSYSSQPSASLVELNATRKLNPPSLVTHPSIHRVSPSPTADSDSRQDTSIVPQSSLLSPGPIMHPRRHSPQPQDGKPSQLYVSQSNQTIHDSSVRVDGNNNRVNYMINSSKEFMEKLLGKTIQGAAFDSSSRDPPPRCHPGTRLAVIARCLEFIAQAAGKKRMLWVVGQAGVGKSAIMQNVAESPLLSVSECASIFLSINGRNDGTKLIVTLVYQLATKCEPYRELIELEIAREPSLLQSSMSVQFKKFLVDPFIDTPLSNSVGRILIIIDGLDECNKLQSQRELLRLISDVCSTYQSSPIVWIIASRPEAHITSFFDQDHVKAVYEKEEIQHDSNEARSDVERLLRAEMTRIQGEFSLSPWSQWPSEQDLWKLASASGGLFVYAQTAINYIGDPEFGDPTSQLDDILTIIDARPLLNVPREQHPLASLDALYARILSKVPERIMVNTRKLLLALALDSRRAQQHRDGVFLVLCNWLGMTCDDAYAAIRHLGAVLSAPKRDEAHKKNLRSFHKSFTDYISDFTRSGFSSDIDGENRQLEVEYSIRILEQAPGGADRLDLDHDVFDSSGNEIGYLASAPGAGSDIVLTWSVEKHLVWADSTTRFEIYKWAFGRAVEGIRAGESVFCTEVYIRLVISQFYLILEEHYPYRQLWNLVFEESRRHEFINSGLLQRVPMEKLEFTRMAWSLTLRFRCPSGITTDLSNPWNPSCQHERTGDWGEGKGEDWTTKFGAPERYRIQNQRCGFCFRRLEQQLATQKTQFPDHNITILFTSAQISFVEYQFIDPDDGVSEWTYWIALEIPKAKRRELGSAANV